MQTKNVDENSGNDQDDATAKPSGGTSADTGPVTGKRSNLLQGRLHFVLAAAFFVLYSIHALKRHQRLGTSAYDLGIFEQAVGAYSRLETPLVPIKGPESNILGDHFHPILITLAPLYRIWPTAHTLLIAQAALIAVSIVPVARLAITRLGPVTGTWLSVAYALSWGLQGALSFDFHEIAFAVPLLAFALAALVEERWRAAVAWTLPMLLVKEDMGLFVAAIGAYMAWRGRRRPGIALIVTGLAAVVLTIKVVLPFFNSGQFNYSAYLGGEGGLLSQALSMPVGLVEEPRKLVLISFLVLLTGGVALRSPIILIAVPSLLSRLASTNPLHWEIGRVHYNAALMPVIFIALLQVLPLLARPSRANAVWRKCAIIIPMLFVLLLHPVLWAVTNPAGYRERPHAVAAHRVLALIPDDALVAAGNNLAPQLTGRCRVVIFPQSHGERVDWVVVDTTLSTKSFKVPDRQGAVRSGLWPPTVEQQRAALRTLPDQGFTKVAERDGVVLYRRLASP
ncbi:DUF2079 domain-containing protein [Actinomadura sp. 21ATH]|uniref:DUF2079 domain-containing protein n=1 Tax=Actinomadura sp. 21ATH TaxID=1735444 RepID=UPI0035BF0DAD